MIEDAGNDETLFERTPNRLTRATLHRSLCEEEIHTAKDVDDLFRKLGMSDADPHHASRQG